MSPVRQILASKIYLESGGHLEAIESMIIIKFSLTG